MNFQLFVKDCEASAVE